MPSASLILHNALVRTMRPGYPEAEAVAVAGERIIAAGTDSDVLSLAGPGTDVVNCAGLTLLPGFIDAHAHILAEARRALFIDCDVCSLKELGAIMRSAATALPAGAWLRGRGYQESKLRERRHPTRQDLDRAAPDRPARLTHASGHASVLNTAALAALGIGLTTEEPAGGQIEREPETGMPTGLLIEMEDWLDRRMPRSDRSELEACVARLSDRLLAAGVTSVQDLGHRNDDARLRLMSSFAQHGIFRPRLTIATGWEAFESGEDSVVAAIGRGPVKIVLNETGEDLEPDRAELAHRVRRVHRAGRQVAIHAIEPRGISACLDAIAATQSDDGRRRHRIEHAAITPPQIARRMSALGVVAVSNPAFLFTNGDRYIQKIGDSELLHLYDVAGLLRAGVRVAAGSDCPVSPPVPEIGITAARYRGARAGHRVPGDGIPAADALGLFTSGAAFAAFEERDKGGIAAGMLGDLVVVDDTGDRIRPVMTVLGGAVVWHSGLLSKTAGYGVAPL